MQTNILAVTGNPVLHSLSPVLMNGAILRNGLQYKYFRLIANSAEEAVKTFKMLNIKGMNVTAPFKQEIIPFLQHLTPNAEKAGAVNCVFVKDNQLWGNNTDITGVELSLNQYPEFLQSGKMLVIGSGGASQGAIIAGQNLGLEVTVAARNQTALQNLKTKFNVKIDNLENLEILIPKFQIIVQALPSGVKVFNPEILKSNQLILDANYKDSIFEPYIKERGFIFLSGRDWLVNQAVPSFEIFTDTDTTPEIMYQALNDYHFEYKGRIALTGFMGVGKTTSGRELAKLTGYKFVDLDQEIETHENMKISQIFELKGEGYFRKLETEMLTKFSNEENIILSCGGIVKNPQNQTILNSNFITIWLYATVKFCIKGLDIQTRPLLQCENPLERAEKLFTERIPFYASCAYAVVNVEDLNSNQMAQKIYEQINRTFGINN